MTNLGTPRGLSHTPFPLERVARTQGRRTRRGRSVPSRRTGGRVARYPAQVVRPLSVPDALWRCGPPSCRGLGRQCGELLPAEGGPGEPPPAFRGLGKNHPGPPRLGRVTGGPGYNFRDLPDELSLSLSGKRSRWGDHLHSDGPGRLRGGRMDRDRREPMEVRGGVVQMERTRRLDSLGTEYGGGQLLTQGSVGPFRKEVGTGIHIDHRRQVNHRSGSRASRGISRQVSERKPSGASGVRDRPPTPAQFRRFPTSPPG